MAKPTGQTTDPLIERLKAEPWTFDFFQAVRLLQSRHREGPRIGESVSPAQDSFRFAQSPSMEFAPSALEAFQERQPKAESEAGLPPVLYSRHFGLFGPNGPLPLNLTEYAHNRIRHAGDRTFAAFCNVFHHRMYSLFFRAWAESHKTVDLDRPEDQRWPDRIGSLFGIGMESAHGRDSTPDWSKLYYSGRLVQQSRNAEGLEGILSDFFGVRTFIQTFVGRWLTLPEGCECRLGATPSTGSMGLNTIVGSRTWDCQLTFRLHLGPMKLADFERLLPTGRSFARLRDWVRFYAGDTFFWQVQFVLAKEEVPALQLGASARLGWTTWLKTKPFDRDADDLVLQAPEN